MNPKAHAPQIRHVHVADVHASARDDPREQAAGAAIDIVAGQDVFPVRHQPRERRERRHTAGKGKGPVAALARTTSHSLHSLPGGASSRACRIAQAARLAWCSLSRQQITVCALESRRSYGHARHQQEQGAKAGSQCQCQHTQNEALTSKSAICVSSMARVGLPLRV